MALRDNPYLPLYIKDFMTDEKLIECCAASTGVYIRVMCVLHKQETYGVILLKQKHKQTDNQIKNFAIQLAQYLPWSVDVIFAGLTELVSEGVLSIEGDSLYQKRMAHDGEVSIKRAASGSVGGKKTQSKFAKAKPKAKTQPNTDIVNGNTIEFNEFYKEYPRKQAKLDAERAWKKLTDTEKELAIKTIPAWFIGVEPQFQPLPASWLNGKRWTDDLTKRHTTKTQSKTGNNPFALDEQFAVK